MPRIPRLPAPIRRKTGGSSSSSSGSNGADTSTDQTQDNKWGLLGDAYETGTSLADEGAGSTDEAIARTFDNKQGGGVVDGTVDTADTAENTVQSGVRDSTLRTINFARNVTGQDSLTEKEAIARGDEFGQNIDNIVTAPSDEIEKYVGAVAGDKRGETASDAFNWGAKAFVSSPLKAGTNIATGVDTETGTKKQATPMEYGEVALEVATLGTGGKALKAVKGASKTDEGASLISRLPWSKSDEATQATDDATQSADSVLDEMGIKSPKEISEQVARTGDSTVDNTGSTFDNILSTGEDVTSTGVRTTDDITQTGVRTSDDVAETTVKTGDNVADESSSWWKGITPSKKTTGVFTLGAGIPLAGLSLTGGVPTMNGDGSSTTNGGGGGGGDGGNDGGDSNNGGSGNTQTTKRNMVEKKLSNNNAILRCETVTVNLNTQKVTVDEVLGYTVIVGAQKDSSTITVLANAEGETTKEMGMTAMGGNAYYPPHFDTVKQAEKAYQAYLSGGGDDGNGQTGWEEAKKLGQQMGWHLYRRDHKTKDKSEFFALGKTTSGEQVSLNADGMPQSTLYTFDTKKAMRDALALYAENVKQGKVKEDNMPTGDTPPNPNPSGKGGGVLDAVGGLSPMALVLVLAVVAGVAYYYNKNGGFN